MKTASHEEHKMPRWRSFALIALALLAVDVLVLTCFLPSRRRDSEVARQAPAHRPHEDEASKTPPFSISEQDLRDRLEAEHLARLAAEQEATNASEELKDLRLESLHSARNEDHASRRPAASEPPPPTVESVTVESSTTTANVTAGTIEATQAVGLEETEDVDLDRCDKDAPCRVKVFFGTDRALVKPEKVPSRYSRMNYYFGSERDLNLPRRGFTLGVCSVTIPTARYEKMSGKLDYTHGVYDPKSSVFIEDDEVFPDEAEWLKVLNRRINSNEEHEAFVFVHGFNVSFVDAARRTAQIYYDLGFHGAPIFYSWPSAGHLWNYWADEASIEWSASHLRDFLDFVAQKSNARKVHLIAHSMGNRALTRALAEIGNRRLRHLSVDCEPDQKKFQQVILAAPDLDTDLFLQLENAIKSAADRITLYESKKDRAVLASWILHRFRRLGFPSGKIPPTHVDTIDATSASTDFLGHSYYGGSVLWDIKEVFDEPAVEITKRCTVKRDAPGYYEFVPQILPKTPGKLKRAIYFVLRQRLPETISGCAPRAVTASE